MKRFVAAWACACLAVIAFVLPNAASAAVDPKSLHDLAFGEETDSSDGNRGQELQAPVERQYLEARVISRVPWHFALR